ncbi:bacteriocin-like WGxF protein [Bacillus stercoris]|uniref:bacteriocin-like WGxF protein n=1 Tax=Bacillus stercoris TaxID=2054641 RepID=UPI000D41CBF4|nr:bacteriocin-like WGxF protein [Bacillus stercoris]MDO7346046.1 bacteriocin-like WGxF protein [Bacillus stercoris]PTU28509.1 hypothetical protein DA469_05855 [Bacillus subtilis]TII15916.1 hypothetical protein C6Y43_09045 [Bacillus subtilis]BEV40937.1 hypothetical protein BSB_40100 [Bacillus stercoris]
MNHFIFALYTSILLIIAGIVHRIIFRVFNLPFDSTILFWGGFVVIYFILALVTSLLFKK